MTTFVYIVTAILVAVWVFYVLYFIINTAYLFFDTKLFCFLGFHKPDKNMRLVDGKWVTNCTVCGRELYMDDNNKWKTVKYEDN